jgi:hypothetical protein
MERDTSDLRPAVRAGGDRVAGGPSSLAARYGDAFEADAAVLDRLLDAAEPLTPGERELAECS